MRFATLLVVCAAATLTGATIFYVDFEHPNMTYWNPKYYAHMKVTALRRSRRDPIHYVRVSCETLLDFGNNIQIDLYVYEFLSNEYRRSFLESHYKLCDAIKNENAFLPYLRKFLPIKSCPFPKGQYNLENVALPDMPLLRTFPFSRGRLFMNVSDSRSRDRVLEGYVDTTIKEKLH